MAKLLRDERSQLVGALRDAFNKIGNFDRLANLFGYIPDDISPGQGITARLEALVDRMDADGDAQLEQIFQVPDLLPEWQDSVPLRAALNLVRQSYRARQSALLAGQMVDPFNALLLDMGRPFIDRQFLRDSLEDINNPQGSRFMVVNGPSGIGKSHSYYLIQSLAPQCGFALSYVELKSGRRAGFHAVDLVKKIKRDLLLPNIDLAHEQQASVEARWAEELGDWLVEELKGYQKMSWIVLDGFDYPDLPEDTRQLVDGLIQAVDEILTNVRLIFLDFSAEKLPQKIRFFVHQENLQEMTQEHLVTFLTRLCELKSIEPDAVKVQVAASQLLKDLPSQTEEHMMTIMARVFSAIKNLALLGKSK